MISEVRVILWLCPKWLTIKNYSLFLFSETIGETIFHMKAYRSKKLNLLFIEWGHMNKNTAVPSYMVKTLWNLLLQTSWLIVTELSIISNSNYDRRLTFTYFTTRSNLIFRILKGRNWKKMHFTVTIALYIKEI